MEREQLKPTCKELSHDEIKKVISHRFPFLLVDKILKVEENTIVGVKNVSGTDPFLQGHFPDRAVYPGVLLIESCAQVGGILVGKLIKGTGYLARVIDFKFTKVVVPGDSIIITARYHSKLQKFIQVDCDAKVEGKLVGKGKIVYSFM